MKIQSSEMVTNLVMRLSNATIIIMCTPSIVIHVEFLMGRVALGQIV
jgi:hypothetical protein